MEVGGGGWLLWILLFLLVSLTMEGSTTCPNLSPSLSSSCSCRPEGEHVALVCTGLNTTKLLVSVREVSILTISQARLSCLHLSHISGMGLKQLSVTRSGLNNILCPGDDFSVLPSLSSLDLSYNNLSTLELATLKSLPRTLRHLDISENALPCSPSLSWLHTWAESLSSDLRLQLERVQCSVENSPSHQIAPLLTVMQYYIQKVNPYCPASCSCHFYHFVERVGDSPYYTVLVNCSGQDLDSFPSLPAETTVLDLSHNLLDQAAYNLLDVVGMNYINLESLILSHNKFTTIDMKFFKLKLHRAFKADHNELTELPYDFSQLLQNFDTKNVTLGHNQWLCSCNAEITGSSLQRKIQDHEQVRCGEGSVPDSIVGRKLTEVDHALLCPPSEKAEKQELALKIVCVVLASLIVMILTKLLYDYWQYRHRGKLPWIVYRMP
jgi:hypothetical protein